MREYYRREVNKTLDAIDKQIEAIESQLRMIVNENPVAESIYEVQDVYGSYPLTELLLARSNCLMALSTLWEE